MIQLESLHSKCDELHSRFGDPMFHAVYGAGCTSRPKYFFIFMNPTARNISSHHDRSGLRCPRIGLKQVRKMFYELGLLSLTFYEKIQSKDACIWTYDFVYELYAHLSEQGVYITNLAKCTQSNAKSLPNLVFREHLDIIHEEIDSIQPQNIIAFGNQVSSMLLGKQISVSSYEKFESYDVLCTKKADYKMYPCYYPVGIGYRNMNKSITKIASL